MTLFVVDASVAIKWFIPEVHSSDALRLRNPTDELHAPELFDAELANILWKKVQRGELSDAKAQSIAVHLTTLPIARHRTSPFITAALALACETGRSAYDCFYLSLAIRLGCVLVTADQRLLNSISATPHARSICWVGNVP